MLNLTNTCTVSGKHTVGVDADTGRALYADSAVMVDQACAFAVVSAEQVTQTWGDGDEPTESNAVHGALYLPSWAPAIDNPSAARVTVDRYPGSWRIVSSRPAPDWTTYLVAMN